ncbi:MAG: arsenate reductase family protein [Clostridia bacterium]|nr:arsenate reductase family protein [Clostridia bacterium]
MSIENEYLNNKKEVKIGEIIFIEYPKCSTCQKAKKWLKENNIDFIERNIISETPTVQELNEWIEKSGKEIKKWFNTSGLKYKELNLKSKLETMSDKEKIELLSSDGMLIKRPLLISNNDIFIGFKEELWKILI